MNVICSVFSALNWRNWPLRAHSLDKRYHNLDHLLHKPKRNYRKMANRGLLHGLLNMMREVFTLPAFLFCSADRRDLSLDILEDTVTVDVMGSMAAFADFKGTIPPAADGWWQCWTLFFGLLSHWRMNNGCTGCQEGHCCDLVPILHTVSTSGNLRYRITADSSLVYVFMPVLFSCFLLQQSE